MTYYDDDISAQDATPVKLLRVRSTALGLFYFAESPVDIAFSPSVDIIDDIDMPLVDLTWDKSGFSIDEIDIGNALAPLEIKFPVTDSTAAALLAYGYMDRVFVSLYRAHAHNLEAGQVVQFVGRVSSDAVEGSDISVSCKSLMAELSEASGGKGYSRHCAHTVYDADCTLDRADFADAGTVTSITGNVVSIPALSGADADDYRAGILEFDGALAHVISHSGANFTLLAVPPSLITEVTTNGSAAVTVAPGCDRTGERCLARFNNRLNRLAFGLPTRNPFTEGFA